jgi:mono/diheme cytochrome c family protein
MEGTVRKMAAKVRRFARLMAVAAGVWVVLGGVSSTAQVIPGESDYKNSCAVCHGPTGEGDGEAVYVLAGLKPANLTQLSKKNGGHFPDQEVYQAIDGRDDIPAHHLGERRMPSWGTNWQMNAGEPNPTSEATTRKRIQDLVSYIKTLQQK